MEPNLCRCGRHKALAGSLETNPYLDAWIKVSPENQVTVYTGKVELGTMRTALAP